MTRMKEGASVHGHERAGSERSNRGSHARDRGPQATGKLDEARKKGWAPLEAIYGSSTDTLTQWVYAEGLAGRSLQGREELQRREAERATSRLLMVAWLTLAVSAIALAVSIIAIFKS
jgi:hypothetical protein